MESHLHVPYLREIVVFLAAAAILVPAFKRLRLSPILGFLVLGLILGPHGLGALADQLGPALNIFVIADVESVRLLAEFGVVFLLFTIGLELSFTKLWAMRRLVFGLGGAQILLSAVAITAVALAWGNGVTAATIFGFGLALSSTALVLPTLIERGEFGSRAGQTAFAVLLMQDVAVAPILTTITVLGAQGEGSPLVVSLIALGKAAAAIALIMLLGRFGLRPLFRLAAGARSREVFMAMVLLTVIATAALTGMAGLSMALGAFLGGLVLAETEYRHAVEVELEPFRGLLLGLFFFSVGMGIDPVGIAGIAHLAAMSVIGLVIIKGGIVFALAWVMGLPKPVAIPAAFALAASGEFVFVIVGLAITLQLVPYDTGQFMLIVASLSLLLAPALVALGARLGAVLEERAERDGIASSTLDAASAEGLADHVIIAGYGRVGRTVARVLDQQEISHIAIDANPQNVAKARQQGAPVFFGDATRPALLHHAGIERARAVAITLDDIKSAQATLAAVTQLRPDLPIVVRARDNQDAHLLRQAGAVQVVPETVESSLQLAGHVVQRYGLSPEMAVTLLQTVREEVATP